ncbi:MAG: phosphate ABC transporter permease PstA [Spongiibacteraceae bacterium]
MKLNISKKQTLTTWIKTGEPYIWLNAAAVAISAIAVVGLLVLLAVRGLGHFWPANIASIDYAMPGYEQRKVVGEIVETETVPIEQLHSAGVDIQSTERFIHRDLIKQGNRDITGIDFVWLIEDYMVSVTYPKDLMVIERREWGNFYGYLKSIKQQGVLVETGNTWDEFQQRIQRGLNIHDDIESIEKGQIGTINYQLERLRLRTRGLELKTSLSAQERAAAMAEIEAERAQLKLQYAQLQQQLIELYGQINRDSFTVEAMDGTEVDIKIAAVVDAKRPNSMTVGEKMSSYVEKLWGFLTDEPREANTEGGIFPAIFGTVMMVLLMSVMVTPFGVIAAVYLREYAKQGVMTRIVRIAVNNLAGVPSIVYGVFGLGFFIYFLGAEVDNALFQEALPAPTFGTPGMLWASITLALLTLPVVIVATEEGLSRIPKALREGSLALGATKAETLWRVVLPMASPAMMTGLILAVARAAGEVAPLMLVGVVKLAPSLPVDTNYPYLHLDQKFMHLGFHIFDVGFQSPNVEAARPLVYATALLLVIIIALLNFSSVALRNHLREKYKSLDM